MKRRRLVLFIIILTWVAVPTSAAAQEPAPLVIAVDELYHGDIATFDQPVLVLGEVDGDITSWFGSITVRGVVRGDIVSYTGSIELDSGAVVEGNVLSLTGGVQMKSGAEANGAVIGIEPLAGSTVTTALINALRGQPQSRRFLPTGISGIIGATITILLTVGLTLIWPRRTAGIGRALRAAPLRSALVGFLSTVLILAALPFVVGLLTLTLIGPILFLPLSLLLHVPYAIGFTGVARALTAAWPPTWALRPPLAAAVGTLIIITPLVVVSTVAPTVALAIGYAVASWGLGAALISRGGALPIWQDRLVYEYGRSD
ncbi:MAG: hypothetical protein C0184_12135 [Chloroflexus aggregans]|uniref:Polymer-forming cytoskeletal protein n=1 Tax=Chloroflexus aggregans TaxID=152260 RepID=A0A2J6X0J7_9CHLR|nr:MAG: hypothetical protein C0184_12135 [Chloroflexus aggregans]